MPHVGRHYIPAASLGRAAESCGRPRPPRWEGGALPGLGRPPRVPLPSRIRAARYLDGLGVGGQTTAVHLLHSPAGLRAAGVLDEGDAAGLIGALVPQKPDVLDVPEGGEALPNQSLPGVLAQHHKHAAVGRLVQALGGQAATAALLHSGDAGGCQLFPEAGGERPQRFSAGETTSSASSSSFSALALPLPPPEGSV